MIHGRSIEAPHDLPADLAWSASTAAIEFDNLRLGRSEKRDAIRELVRMLEEIRNYKGRTMLFFDKTALYSLTKEQDPKKALEVLDKMIWELDKATCLILSPEEYAERRDMCLAISRNVSRFSHITMNY
jgi:hypothetical protein